jgi:hypothetical protein
MKSLKWAGLTMRARPKRLRLIWLLMISPGELSTSTHHRVSERRL